MIVTLTLNPSLDLTYTLAERGLGEVDVHRAVRSTLEASGKGVNVSRTLRRAGVATLAVLPAAGEPGRYLGDLLASEGVEHVSVATGGQTRINTSVLLDGGGTVKVNGPGASLTGTDIAALARALEDALGTATGPARAWAAICGSLPPGLEPDVVGDLVGRARRSGARTAVDTSGPALAAALQAGADLLAPNSLELADLVDGSVAATDVRSVAQAAASLAREAGVTLLVSMGSRGAVYTDGERALHGGGPALRPVNTAGAGDAFLAGWLAHEGEPAERMRRALAFGRSACLAAQTVDPEPGTKGGAGIVVTDIEVS